MTTEDVTVHLGPKSFCDGHFVCIESVESASSSLEIGDEVIILGKYRLDSQDDARLVLFLTQTDGDGTEEKDSVQFAAIKRRWREFTASITIKQHLAPGGSVCYCVVY